MKKYPIKHNHPHSENMLIDFTIYPDIKLFEVPANVFYNYNRFDKVDEKEIIGTNR